VCRVGVWVAPRAVETGSQEAGQEAIQEARRLKYERLFKVFPQPLLFFMITLKPRVE